MSTDITTYLKYANLQMAAESLFGVPDGAAPGELGSDMSVASLTKGNNRSSKFTDAQAAEFAANWAVVEHKSNTATTKKGPGSNGTTLSR